MCPSLSRYTERSFGKVINNMVNESKNLINLREFLAKSRQITLKGKLKNNKIFSSYSSSPWKYETNRNQSSGICSVTLDNVLYWQSKFNITPRYSSNNDANLRLMDFIKKIPNHDEIPLLGKDGSESEFYRYSVRLNGTIESFEVSEEMYGKQSSSLILAVNSEGGLVK